MTFGDTEDNRFNSGCHASPICKGLRQSENLAVTMPLGGRHFCAVIRRCQELLLSAAVPARGSQESGLALSVCSSSCGCVGTQLLRDLAPGFPCLTQTFDPGAGNEYPETAQTLAFVACRRQASPHPLRDTNAFLLRDCGHDGNHRVAEDSAAVEVLLLVETAIATP